ncbi:MAG: hypothetical protein F6K11_20315 [Leptolyngbya sp. SIO3F4]|nr:hypothetical protein [Leptolyngbya sp. SIO3F4]
MGSTIAARHVDLMILHSMRRCTAGGLAVSDVTHLVIDTFTCSSCLVNRIPETAGVDYVLTIKPSGGYHPSKSASEIFVRPQW